MAAILGLGLTPVAAAPMGGVVVAGDASFAGIGTANTTIRQASDRAVIEWQGFDLAADESVEFIVPNSTSATLNHIVGSAASQLSGTVRSNGAVYFVNPNGLVFDAASRVMANGFLASTSPISSQSFMQGSLTSHGDHSASVVLNGTVTAESIIAKAGQVTVGGNLSGSTIELRSTTLTEIGAVAVITAAPSGTVMIWSDGHTDYQGSIIAPLGMVEVSGKQTLSYRGSVNSRTADGRRGSLLLDPAKVEIVETAGSDSTVTYITRYDLTEALDGNHVTINATDNTTTGLTAPSFVSSTNGSITVKSIIDSTGNGNSGNLTLTADVIKLEAAIKIKGSLTLNSQTVADGSASVSLGADIATTGGVTINSNGGNLVLTGNVTVSGGAVELNLGTGNYDQDSTNGYILDTSGKNLTLTAGALVRKSGTGVIFRIGEGSLTIGNGSTVVKASQTQTLPFTQQPGYQIDDGDHTEFDAATAYYFTTDTDAALADDKTSVGGTSNFWLPIEALGGIASKVTTPTVQTTVAGLGIRFTDGDFGWSEVGTITDTPIVTRGFDATKPAYLYNVTNPSLPATIANFSALHFAGSNSLGAATLNVSSAIVFDPNSTTSFSGDTVLKTPKVVFDGTVTATGHDFTVDSETAVLNYQGTVPKAANLWFKGAGLKMTGQTELDGQDLFIDIGTGVADFGGNPNNGGSFFDDQNNLVSLKTSGANIFYHGGKLQYGTIEFTYKDGAPDDASVFYSSNFFAADQTLTTSDIPRFPERLDFDFANSDLRGNSRGIMVMVDGLATLDGIDYNPSNAVTINAKGITVSGTASRFGGNLSLVNLDANQSITVSAALTGGGSLNLYSNAGDLNLSAGLTAGTAIRLETKGGDVNLGSSLTSGADGLYFDVGNGMVILTAAVTSQGGAVTLNFDEQGGYNNTNNGANAVGYSWTSTNQDIEIKTTRLTLGTGAGFVLGSGKLIHNLPRFIGFNPGKNYYFTSDLALTSDQIFAINGDGLAEVHSLDDLNNGKRGPRFYETTVGSGSYSYNALYPDAPDPGSRVVFWNVRNEQVSVDLSPYRIEFGGWQNSFRGTLNLNNSQLARVQEDTILKGNITLGSGGLMLEDRAKLIGGTITTAANQNLVLQFDTVFTQAAGDSRLDAGDNSLIISSPTQASGYIRLLREDNRFASLSLDAPNSWVKLVSRDKLIITHIHSGSLVLESQDRIIASEVQASSINFNAKGEVSISGTFGRASGSAQSVSLTNSSAGLVLGAVNSDSSISLTGRGSVIITGSLSAQAAIEIDQPITLVTDTAFNSRDGAIHLSSTVNAINSATLAGLSLNAGAAGVVSLEGGIGQLARLGWLEIRADRFYSFAIPITTVNSLTRLNSNGLAVNRRW
ncbi:MAG: filamentous hemagglutinin N-terminal domain-containing protein [Candidatus Pacebacteria bacterium]|nr:filamentous hemagglutinin N-terminal domain-containing protein [Candidatus Paceibacterota bacterium]